MMLPQVSRCHSQLKSKFVMFLLVLVRRKRRSSEIHLHNDNAKFNKNIFYSKLKKWDPRIQ